VLPADRAVLAGRRAGPMGRRAVRPERQLLRAWAAVARAEGIAVVRVRQRRAVRVAEQARLQAACRMLNYLIISAFLLYAIGMGLWLSWISRERSFQGMPEVSYSWVTMAMPVGAALLLVTTALKARAELAR